MAPNSISDTGPVASCSNGKSNNAVKKNIEDGK
jgi:hypothetical protein